MKLDFPSMDILLVVYLLYFSVTIFKMLEIKTANFSEEHAVQIFAQLHLAQKHKCQLIN